MRRFLLSFVVVGMLVTGSVQAQPSANTQPTVVEVSPIYDPLEPFNRAVFQFNTYVDFMILKPVTWLYKSALPEFMQNSVSSFLNNLASPVYMLNHLLQGNFRGFEATLHRFVINSTLGIGGLIDVASYHGLPNKDAADFGQTLGVWGMGHGAYLVLPIVGPSSLRDGTGRVVDTVADPFNQIWMDSETEWPIYTRAGLTIIDKRAKYGEQYDKVMGTAVDPYVTFRSIYSQRRAYMVQDKSTDAYDAVQ
jgi:phospholipid-binding lipoprotein MlaA